MLLLFFLRSAKRPGFRAPVGRSRAAVGVSPLRASIPNALRTYPAYGGRKSLRSPSAVILRVSAQGSTGGSARRPWLRHRLRLRPASRAILIHPEQGKSKLVIWDAKGRCPSAHPGRERCPLHLGYRSPLGRGARRIPCPCGDSVSGLIRVKVKPLRGRLRRTLTLHHGRKNILKIYRAY